MLARILVSLLLFTIAGFASAQTPYPAKSMRMIIPYPPGGGTDILGRPIAKLLGDNFQVSSSAKSTRSSLDLSRTAHQGRGRKLSGLP